MRHPISPKATTISKIGCRKIQLSNGLRLIVPHGELDAQFRSFGQELAAWSRGRSVTFIAILQGGAYTWQRLAYHFPEDSNHTERSIVAQSYGDGQEITPVKIYDDWLVPARDIRGRDVVLIDDIQDSSDTMEAAVSRIATHGPASIHTFFMLRKNRPRNVSAQADWVMFDIDDVWVVGGGLDEAGRLRHLHYIAEMPRSLGKR